MAAQKMPAAEVEIDERLVRALLADQHPDLADRSLRLLTNGWDNVIYRLGDELLVRIPRRQLAADLVEYEQRWLPELAPRLPIPIPAPVRAGRPALGYPWHWSVCPWFDGEEAVDAGLRDSTAEARRLGEFLVALHVPAPADAPVNPFRAHRIDRLSERVDLNLFASGTAVDTEAVRALWAKLVTTPEWDGPQMWAHGDLHAGNVLIDDGTISAVIDFGDITSGDPAVDLAIAWMLFGPEDRAVFRAAAGAEDDALWRRGRAWALHFALMYLAHSADDPRLARMGTHLLPSVLAGES